MTAIALAVIDTTIAGKTVRMRLADNADPAQATEWVEFHVSLAALMDPADTRRQFGDPERHFLGGVQLAALLQARDALDREIQRLRAVARGIF